MSLLLLFRRTPVLQAAATFNGGSALSAHATLQELAAATFAGSGSFSALTTLRGDIEARFAGAGALSIEGRAVQIIRPNADETDGGWTNELGGTELFSHIDEHLIDDADYIQSSPDPVTDLTKIAFGDTDSGGITQPAVLRYRYKKEGIGIVNLQVRLLQGATEIASWAHNDISALYVTGQQTLTEGEVEAIADPNDLFIEFTADAA